MKTLINKNTNVVLAAISNPETYPIESNQIFIDLLNTIPCPSDENGIPFKNMFEKYNPETNTIQWWEFTGDPVKFFEWANS